MKILITYLDHYNGLKPLQYQTAFASGVDLYAAINDPITLLPRLHILVKTGFKLAIPQGFEAQIRPRSGLALKKGITVLNTPGTVDADYRGEVGVILHNTSDEPFIIGRGERIAQMVIVPVEQVEFEQTDTLPDSGRGAGGFGSTGTT